MTFGVSELRRIRRMDYERLRWVRRGESAKNASKRLRGFKSLKHVWVIAIYKLTARHKRTQYKGSDL